MIKVGLHTLGCKVNQSETEEIKNILAGRNFQIVDPHKFADIYIINTCTVTHTADSKSRQAIRKGKLKNKKAKIIVTGCYVNYDQDNLSQIADIDFIIKQEDKFKIPDIISNPQSTRPTTQASLGYPGLGTPNPQSTTRTRTFIKIQDGCNQFCSYCIVPYVRPNMYSIPVTSILTKIRTLPRECEVVLCGIRIGLYQDEFLGKKIKLPELLSLLNKEENIIRIRISSIEPQDVSDELINVLSESEKICPHLHLPLQSGDDEILNKMKRCYTTDDYYNLVVKLKSKIKNISLTTDVIVGFPQESEKHFLNSLNFIKKIDFLKMHIFKYSKRNGTSAAALKSCCTEKEKNERSKILLKLSEEKGFTQRCKYLDKTLNVLVEEKDKKNNLYCGYSENYIKIHFDGAKDRVGKIVKTKIIDVKENITYGSISI